MAATARGNETDIVTKVSDRSVSDIVSHLARLIDSKKMRLFALIDQSEEARRVGLDLRDTVLVMFGSPAAGTPVMVAAPLAALDLPLKVLIWEDGDQTNVSYYAPDALLARHGLSPEVGAALAGIDALTDSLVAL